MLVCQDCEQRYSLDETIWRCLCGGLLDIEFNPSFPLTEIATRPQNLWRYREALPIESDESILRVSFVQKG